MNIKPFFSYEQQIEELQRKVIILNHDECLDFLKDVNYYRFSAYLLPYKGKTSGLEFNRIKKMYEFDSKLRSLIIPVIENIEIKFRSRLAYLFSKSMELKVILSLLISQVDIIMKYYGTKCF